MYYGVKINSVLGNKMNITSAEMITYFSAYTTHKKKTIPLDKWFQVCDKVRPSKDLKTLRNRV